jgi:CheY-like chemotaxis protein
MAHILVIDDDPHMRALLRRVLENDGHSVTLANDGEDALTLVDSSVELVITDILMPQLAVSKQLNF